MVQTCAPAIVFDHPPSINRLSAKKNSIFKHNTCACKEQVLFLSTDVEHVWLLKPQIVCKCAHYVNAPLEPGRLS